MEVLMRISFNMKAVFVLVIFFVTLFCSSLVYGQDIIQTFPKGKIYLKDGGITQGTNLEISKDIAYLNVSGLKKEFQMSNIRQIQAKKDKAKKWGSTCAGSCIGLSLGSLLASGGETTDAYGNTQSIDTGQYILSAALWAGIFYGGGYLIGSLLDNWETVYFGN